MSKPPRPRTLTATSTRSQQAHHKPSAPSTPTAPSSPFLSSSLSSSTSNSSSRAASPAPSLSRGTNYRYAIGPAPVRFPPASPSPATNKAGDEMQRARTQSALLPSSSSSSTLTEGRRKSLVASSSNVALAVPTSNGRSTRGREESSSARQRTQSSPSPSPSRTSISSDISTILRRSPSPSLSSSTTHGASLEPQHLAPPNEAPLRPALQRRPTSQTFLTTFPFPHPSASPDAYNASEGGAWAWLTSALPSWRGGGLMTRRRSDVGTAASASGSDATPTAATAGDRTPLLSTYADQSGPKRTQTDAADPYGYRHLAGPDLLPSFHAPRVRQAQVQAGVSARRKFATALLCAVGALGLLGLLGKVGVGVLRGAGWPGLGGGLS